MAGMFWLHFIYHILLPSLFHNFFSWNAFSAFITSFPSSFLQHLSVSVHTAYILYSLNSLCYLPVSLPFDAFTYCSPLSSLHSLPIWDASFTFIFSFLLWYSLASLSLSALTLYSCILCLCYRDTERGPMIGDTLLERIPGTFDVYEWHAYTHTHVYGCVVHFTIIVLSSVPLNISWAYIFYDSFWVDRYLN